MFSGHVGCVGHAGGTCGSCKGGAVALRQEAVALWRELWGLQWGGGAVCVLGGWAVPCGGGQGTHPS